MFANTLIQNTTSKMLLGTAAILMTGLLALAPGAAANAQSRTSYPEVKDVKPDSKGCFVRNGKKYCYKPEGASSKVKAAPTDPQALKDCFWHVDKNGKKRLACIYYAY
jgi:hypothetical protein